MSNIVGFDLKPQPETSLKNMLEYGLNKHLQKYVTQLFTWIFVDKTLLCVQLDFTLTLLA